MQKQKKQFLLVLILLVVCIGAFFGMNTLKNQQEKKEEAKASAERITVTSLDTDTIDSFSYQYNGQELTFEKEEDTWYLSSDKTINISQSMIASMLSQVADMTAEQQITGVEDLAEYGLDAPLKTITLHLGEDTMTINIGMYNSITSQYYLMVSGGNNVYLVGSSIYTTFEKSVEDLIEQEAAEEGTDDSTGTENNADAGN